MKKVANINNYILKLDKKEFIELLSPKYST